ncbi:hypothetical protein [Saccharothrix variisporea]|uniref:hypothetical protein n=1 Tax=Saccharothrix variisporea TaxID=543527 RepID=UPI0011C3CE9D|nr:hypothetical protein [Saccharothrix variisporea]
MEPRELFPAVLAQFRARRCLLVLDNLESVLATGPQAGRLREEYADYETFLDVVTSAEHRSQVLIMTGKCRPTCTGTACAC